MPRVPRAADRVHVALVAPPWFEVPPDGYGGIEQMVAGLANGLTAHGHDVTLLGAGEDRTDASFLPTFEEPPPGLGTPMRTTIELTHAARASARIEALAVDLVHDHSVAGPLLAPYREVPTVVTAHGPITDQTAAFYASLPGIALVALSDAQRAATPELPWVATVPNGIDVAAAPFRSEKDDLFVFLGRMSPDKGVEDAIEIARATGTPLMIAAKADEPRERAYLEQTVEPLLGEDARYVGPVDADEKGDLLARAKALLFPIDWEEPFGLVMVEAMACGTPVLATRRGSVPEVVIHGETGFIADDPTELVDLARRLPELDPRACRAWATERFDTSVMVRGYEAAYAAVLARRWGSVTPPSAQPTVA
jgi:glycosyltransferase involved in cell wall biosynthesis